MQHWNNPPPSVVNALVRFLPQCHHHVVWTNLARLNSNWCSIIIQYLWSKPSFGNPSKTPLKAFLQFLNSLRTNYNRDTCRLAVVELDLTLLQQSIHIHLDEAVEPDWLNVILQKCIHLQILRIGNFGYLDSSAVSSLRVKGHSLTTLDLNGAQNLTPKSLEKLLPVFYQLQELNLSETFANDDVISLLPATNPQLRILNLSKITRINPNVLSSAIASLKLSKVDLSHTKCNDDVLRYLSQSQTIPCSILLRGTKITEQGLLTLTHYHGNEIEELDISDCSSLQTMNHVILNSILKHLSNSLHALTISFPKTHLLVTTLFSSLQTMKLKRLTLRQVPSNVPASMITQLAVANTHLIPIRVERTSTVSDYMRGYYSDITPSSSEIAISDPNAVDIWNSTLGRGRIQVILVPNYEQDN